MNNFIAKLYNKRILLIAVLVQLIVILGFFVALIQPKLNKTLSDSLSTISFINTQEKFLDVSGSSFGHEAKYEPEVDVDNDGKLEKVLITWEAMNHGPHKIQIIKDNEVIFTVSDTQVELIPSSNHNGFYIVSGLYGEEGLCCRIGDKLTKFDFENGEFKPVWQQDTKYLKTQN